MATTVKTGWLHDKNGDKFAPKTLTSQVQTSDGTLLEDKIQADLDAAKTEILANVTIPVDEALSPTSENPVQNKVVNSKFEEVDAIISAMEESINSKVDSAALSNYYAKTEIDSLELITVDDIDTICGGTIQYAEDVMF